VDPPAQITPHARFTLQAARTPRQHRPPPVNGYEYRNTVGVMGSKHKISERATVTAPPRPFEHPSSILTKGARCPKNGLV
jgi:hypothetical protein